MINKKLGILSFMLVTLLINSCFAKDNLSGNSKSNFLVSFFNEQSITTDTSLTTNYIWRGQSQTADKPAIQAGTVIENNNFYIENWASSILKRSSSTKVASIEVRSTLGYSNTLAAFLDQDWSKSTAFNFDYTLFRYPGVSEYSFEEFTASFSIYGLGLKYSLGVDDAPNYVAIFSSYGFGPHSLGIEYGNYDKIGKNITLGYNLNFYKEYSVAASYFNFMPDEGSGRSGFFATFSASF